MSQTTELSESNTEAMILELIERGINPGHFNYYFNLHCPEESPALVKTENQ